MLKLALINKNQDFIEYCVSNNMTSSVVFICPNPNKADHIRQQFKNNQNNIKSEINSVTIAKFIKDGLRLAENTSKQTIQSKGKSELILLLGAIWKKLERGQNFTEFRRSFNLLTEFRSYSTEDSVLETLLENYDEKMAESVLWLHRFINQLELVDEHKAYSLFAQLFDEGHFTQEQDLVFYGFDFFTGTQVDFLKTLAKSINITIPYYADLYEKKTNFDWVSWVLDENVELIHFNKTKPSHFLCPMNTFSKNYLGKTLLELKRMKKISGVVLGTPTIEQTYLQEIPFSNMEGKIKVDIFEEDFYALFEDLFSQRKAGLKDLDKIFLFLDKEKIKNIKLKAFRKLKIIFLIKDKIEEWSELSSENTQLDLFDFHIIKESVFLDLPRLNLTHLSNKTDTFVESINGIENIVGEDIVFILSSFYRSPTTKGQTFTESVEKYLSSVGPIRRTEYDLQLLKNKITEFVWLNNVHFLIERNFLQHNAKLNSLFNEIEFQASDEVNLPITGKEYPCLENWQVELKTLSATKLQKYIDCPRKYFLSYGEGFSPDISIAGVLSPLDLGRIQHYVIEKYFLKQKNKLDEHILDECVTTEIKIYFSEDTLQFRQYFVEVKSYTMPAIQFLINLVIKVDGKINFEVPFSFIENELKYNGSIDCVIESKSEIFIIDFKRSNYSFTGFSAICDFEQVQLWFYLKRLKELGLVYVNSIALGYLDLSEIENSMFVVNSQDLYSTLINTDMSTENDSAGKAKVKLLDEWEQAYHMYENLENSIITKIRQDKNFYPSPRKANTCDHCIARRVCSRMAMGGVS